MGVLNDWGHYEAMRIAGDLFALFPVAAHVLHVKLLFLVCEKQQWD